jgi:beta-glucosidase/6-phospho-beta-glucosidase/beta-galactosidase
MTAFMRQEVGVTLSAIDGDAVSFPKGFLFGAATAAYQVEGSVDAGGRGVSIWDTFSHTAGNTFNGDTGDVACDHFLRLEEDLDLMAELGARAYRFSVSWPRIQPTGKGPANPEGLDFYRRVRYEYLDIPVLVTENGAAYGDYVAPNGSVRDPDRIRYLDGHLRAVLQARIAGADVRGYFVWSLLDDFEWAHGYSKRFGLVWVDYPTRTRIPKDSFRWYSQTVQANALPPAADATARLHA